MRLLDILLMQLEDDHSVSLLNRFAEYIGHEVHHTLASLLFTSLCLFHGDSGMKPCHQRGFTCFGGIETNFSGAKKRQVTWDYASHYWSFNG